MGVRKLLMRQARTVLSTYSADVFGICSALYELGGMIVMHDASGCNSTYSTHDEPRWYHSDSLVFISGLTEMEAIMGDDEKIINDMVSAIEKLHPAFAVIAGTPIPMLTGCDLEAVAAEVERRTGIPCFGFMTNAMRSYLCGASEALAAFADRMTKENMSKRKGSINILGATPLDFSLSGTVESIRKILEDNGWNVTGCWAMGSSFKELENAGEAEVNLVISSVGMKLANVLKEKFGTPYVVGTPIGTDFTEIILKDLKKSAADGIDRIAFCECALGDTSDTASGDAFANDSKFDAGRAAEFTSHHAPKCFIIGESVTSRSLAAAIWMKTGVSPTVVCTLEELPELDGILASGDIYAMEEEEIQKACARADIVIADPMYDLIMPADSRKIALPHEAFSGRIYRRDIPNLTEECFVETIADKISSDS